MASKPRIGLDVDGTLYETWRLANEVCERLVGEEIIFPWPSYDHLRKVYGDEVAEAAFLEACGPEKVQDRELYPGCAEALNEISKVAHIHFLTHSPLGQRMRPSLEEWISSFLDADFDLTIVETLNKIRVAKRENMFGIIDDRPETIRQFLDAGLFAATIYHDYLNEVIQERKDLVVFNTWEDAPILVMEGMKRRGMLKVPQRAVHRVGSRTPVAAK